VSEIATADLTDLWVPLLRRLTDDFPSWGLWKNADAALAGHGDFDSTAPVADWDAITMAFRDWAGAHDHGPVAACRHVPGVLFLVAVDRASSKLLELDVNARKYFRGWTLFCPENLAPLMEIDERGFRRVRPGAEGVILLTQNGLRWGGRPDRAGLQRKQVAEILRRDPAGVRAAARLFGPAAATLCSAAERVAEGGWDRRAMMTVEAWALLRAVAQPHIALTRLWAKEIKKRCPVLRAIFGSGRRIDDVDGWVKSVTQAQELVPGGRS
jgi:hypothetical protein